MTDLKGKTTGELVDAINAFGFVDDAGHPLTNLDLWDELRRRSLTGSLDLMHDMVERFNVDLIGVRPPDRPTLLSFDRGEFRLGHLREELTEVEDALSAENLEDTVDGLLDLVYVALGSLIEMGIAPGAAFEEVHLANMKRQSGLNPDRGDVPLDAVKPEGWKPPDLAPYLDMTRDDLLHLVALKAEADAYTGDGEHDDDLLEPPAEKRRPKVLIIGHARHGKDTVAEYLRDKHLFTFMSSSLFCAKRIMLPHFNRGQGGREVIYHTAGACFADRSNNRQEWYDTIRDFNRPDASRLGRAIFEEHDLYCGLRSSAEFHALKNAGVFDVCIWVDRSEHLPPEDRSSCTVEPWMADYVLDNNGSLDDLHFNIERLMEALL